MHNPIDINPSAYATEALREIISSAFAAAMEAGALAKADIPAFNIEIPADRSHGDFSSNAAMASARGSSVSRNG